MNTPIENLILDLLGLEENNNFETRHGLHRQPSQVLRMAIILAERRLQEEADTIIKAYNSAGGPIDGHRYYNNIFRQGPHAEKSYAGFKYTLETFRKLNPWFTYFTQP